MPAEPHEVVHLHLLYNDGKYSEYDVPLENGRLDMEAVQRRKGVQLSAYLITDVDEADGLGRGPWQPIKALQVPVAPGKHVYLKEAAGETWQCPHTGHHG